MFLLYYFQNARSDCTFHPISKGNVRRLKGNVGVPHSTLIPCLLPDDIRLYHMRTRTITGGSMKFCFRNIFMHTRSGSKVYECINNCRYLHYRIIIRRSCGDSRWICFYRLLWLFHGDRQPRKTHHRWRFTIINYIIPMKINNYNFVFS